MRTTLFAALVSTSALTAQYVSPAHFERVEGTTNNSYPFGASATLYRYAQIHDDVPTMYVQGLAFRHDSVFSGAPRAPYTLTLDVWMSTAAPGITSQTASAVFENNHGFDKLQVVTNRTINVPGNDPSQLPNAFVLDVPFDPGVAFAFAGEAMGASLVWEVQVTARTNGGVVPFDAVNALTTSTVSANPPLAATKAFTGCLATGRTEPMSVSPTATAMGWPGGTGALQVNATQLESNGLIVWINGTDRAAWAGVPLPFDVPGSAGAPSGACTLHTDLGFLTVAVASATGTSSLALAYRATPSLHGAVLYTQVLGIDAPANPTGLTLSNLAAHQIVAPYAAPCPACRIFLGGSLGSNGTVSTTSFLVTKFY